MFSKKKICALAFASMMLFVSCDKSINDNNSNEVPPVVEEVIHPFKALIVSGTSAGSQLLPSIDLVDFEGDTTFTSNLYSTINGHNIIGNPKSIVKTDDYIYLATQNSVFTEANYIYILNSADYTLKKSIELEASYIPININILTNGSLVVACSKNWSSKSDYRLLVIDDVDGAHSIRKIEFSANSVQLSKQIGDKLFVVIPSYYSNGVDYPAQTLVYDIDNINDGEHRVISEEIGNVFIINDNFIVDGESRVWFFGADVNGDLTMNQLDVTKEEVVYTLPLPSISHYDGISVALANDDTTMYIRSQKSLYKIDLNNPEVPAEPIAALMGTFSNISSLSVAQNGNVLVLTTKTGSVTAGHLHEFTPTEDDTYWEDAKSYEVVPHGRYILDLR